MVVNRVVYVGSGESDLNALNVSAGGLDLEFRHESRILHFFSENTVSGPFRFHSFDW